MRHAPIQIVCARCHGYQVSPRAAGPKSRGLGLCTPEAQREFVCVRFHPCYMWECGVLPWSDDRVCFRCRLRNTLFVGRSEGVLISVTVLTHRSRRLGPCAWNRSLIVVGSGVCRAAVPAMPGPVVIGGVSSSVGPFRSKLCFRQGLFWSRWPPPSVMSGCAQNTVSTNS